MPPGIPVATVAIDGSKNAAILVAEMIAVNDESMAAKLAEFRAGGAK
jgi:5-(carboxyamino)imidazole ribonucleotide mutase